MRMVVMVVVVVVVAVVRVTLTLTVIEAATTATIATPASVTLTSTIATPSTIAKTTTTSFYTYMSLITPLGYHSSTCGYCGHRNSAKSSATYGAWAHTLTCTHYRALMDRGWRRSGKYLYKPRLTISCCPQYAIRLDPRSFIPSKQHRQLINKFNLYIDSTHCKRPARNTPFDLEEEIMYAERHSSRLTTLIEPAQFTDEKLQLYRNYQVAIHHDSPNDITVDSFTRFLCDSPLIYEPLSDITQDPDQNHPGYGSFHMLYRLDNRLIAIAVLDFLPQSVSSVYFIYDPSLDFKGLGKLSAMREVQLTRHLNPTLNILPCRYYMGLYIHHCQKMVYKGQYRPSEILDPFCYEWVHLDTVKSLLDNTSFTNFIEPIHSFTLPSLQNTQSGDTHTDHVNPSDSGIDMTERLALDAHTHAPVSQSDIDDIIILHNQHLIQFKLHPRHRHPQKIETITQFIQQVGPIVASQCVVDLP